MGKFHDQTLGLPASDSEFAFSLATAAGSRRIPRDSLLPFVNVKHDGATGDGTTDDAAAIQACIDANGGKRIYLPTPSVAYLLGSMLTTDDASPVVLFGDGVGSVLKKGFNGDMISLGKRSVMRDLYLNGNGATYTGRGVIMTTGSGGDAGSKRLIDNCFIMDTVGYGVEYTAASAGYASVISNCTIVPLAGVAAIKYPTAAESNGNRTISNLWAQSNPIVDFGTSDNSTVVGCNGGVPIMASGTLKASINGGRFVSTTGWTVNGNNIAVNGVCITSNAITFASTLIRARFNGNGISSGTTFTDSAPGVTQENDIDIPSAAYTPTWAGGTVAIGNGSLTGWTERVGQRCHVNIKLIGGASTNWGGATAWTFTVPYSAYRDQVGTVMVFDSSTSTFYPCLCEIKSTATVVKIIGTTPVASYGNSTNPITWATSDTLTLDLWYWIYNV